MSARPEDYCNDCAWPEACGRNGGCVRRDQKEVRAAAERPDGREPPRDADRPGWRDTLPGRPS